MRQKLLITGFLFFAACMAKAQFIPNTNIPIAQYGQTLNAGMAGGLTAVQFSDIDFNNDGINDLFIFDRGAWTAVTFLKDAAGKYSYAPQYEKIFPHLEDWAFIRDYNCDGVPDIFTYSLGSTKVFRGVRTGDDLSFVLAKDPLVYNDGAGTIPLYTSRTDDPGIDDIDQDGDLDILSFSVSNTTIRFYKNMSQENGYGCDSLIFIVQEICWGELYEGFSCYGGDLHVICKGDATAENAEKEALHIGSTIVTFDKDGDGDADAILGDNSCDNLVYYRNGGDMDYASIDSKDTLWPDGGVTFDMPTFPGPYLIDADNDGDKDLVATTNDDLLGLNTEHVWLYENLNTNDTFDFVFSTDTFLVSQMIDAGGYSKPVYFDYNNDGLKDIVLGVSNTYGKDRILHHGLWLYENSGTVTSPAFTLITRDFAGLNTYGLSYVSPAFCDLDNDGDEDMVIGSYDGALYYFENLSDGTGDATFAAPVYPWQSIDVGAFSAPCFIDIDKDNKQDLVIGEQNGNLNYYHNTGTPESATFTLQSEIWGGVDVRKPGFITGYSQPFLFRNEHDSLYLLVGSQSGYVFEFNEIEDALAGEFYQADSNYLKYFPGFYSTIQGADINNDGALDFICGNVRGGLSIMQRDNGVSVQEPEAKNAIQLFPNPVTDQLHIYLQGISLTAMQYHIYSLSGQLIQSGNISGNSAVVSTATLPAGMYFISLKNELYSGAANFIKTGK